MNEPGGALVYYSFFKKFILKVSSAMLMEHFLCDDVGGKQNVCEMGILKKKIIKVKYQNIVLNLDILKL